MVRFADDLVMVFANENDARRVMAALPGQLGRYGLTLHPTKTRLFEFRPSTGDKRPPQPGQRSFEFLGFTHYWDRARRGSWVVKHKTAPSRFSRTLKRMAQWIRVHRHEPVAWQHQQLVRKIRGHDNYYGVFGNSAALSRFRHELMRIWRKWLDRRSNKARMTWERFERVVAKRLPLPAPVVRYHLWGARAVKPCR
jgi:hypothetical protein